MYWPVDFNFFLKKRKEKKSDAQVDMSEMAREKLSDVRTLRFVFL